MKWIEFRGTFLNLEQVTHWGVTKAWKTMEEKEDGKPDMWQIRAYLSFGHDASQYSGQDSFQASVVLDKMANKQSCYNDIRAILQGEYNLTHYDNIRS